MRTEHDSADHLRTIKWGPVIAIDRERPAWLDDDARVLPKWPEWSRLGDGARVGAISDHGQWGDVVALRLRPDHPHYQQVYDDADRALSLVKELAAYTSERSNPEGGWYDVFCRFRSRAQEIAPVTPLDRFMAAHPTADRATAEKALEWGRE